MTEPGSAAFNGVVEGRQDVLVSELTVTEVVSALARRVRQGTVPRALARRVQHAIVAQLEAAVYERLELTSEVHRHAEHFLMTLSEVPLRAADALHLALATTARAASTRSEVRLIRPSWCVLRFAALAGRPATHEYAREGRCDRTRSSRCGARTGA